MDLQQSLKINKLKIAPEKTESVNNKVKELGKGFNSSKEILS